MIICGQAAGILQSHNYDGGIVCQCDKWYWYPDTEGKMLHNDN